MTEFQILSAVRDGISTANTVAIALSITRVHASVVLHNLHRKGSLRWTGEYAAKAVPGPGRLAMVIA